MHLKDGDKIKKLGEKIRLLREVIKAKPAAASTSMVDPKFVEEVDKRF